MPAHNVYWETAAGQHGNTVLPDAYIQPGAVFTRAGLTMRVLSVSESTRWMTSYDIKAEVLRATQVEVGCIKVDCAGLPYLTSRRYLPELAGLTSKPVFVEFETHTTPEVLRTSEGETQP